VRRQLEPLPFTTGQRRERLAEGEVAQPDVGEPFQDRMSRGRTRIARVEEPQGLRDGIASTSLMSRPPR
jgi:hypothetical protein